jgi:hypothetical protein
MKLCSHAGPAGVKEVYICFTNIHVTAEGVAVFYDIPDRMKIMKYN